MIKQMLSLSLLASANFLFSQIGINTTNPQTTFHIDGAKDNPSFGVPSGSQQLNDFTVNSSGNVGIGTVNPTTKLDIQSGSQNAIRIVDTTQGLGKVLTSDSNGYAKWSAPGTSFAKLATVPTTERIVATMDDPAISGDQWIAYSGSSITLPAGKYQVNFTMWCAPSGNAVTTSNAGFASVFLSTSENANNPPAYLSSIKSIIIPRLYNVGASSPDYYGSGNIAVSIPATTTLYLWVYMSDANWSGNTKNIRFRYDPGSYGPYVQMYAVPFDVE